MHGEHGQRHPGRHWQGAGQGVAGGNAGRLMTQGMQQLTPPMRASGTQLLLLLAWLGSPTDHAFQAGWVAHAPHSPPATPILPSNLAPGTSMTTHQREHGVGSCNDEQHPQVEPHLGVHAASQQAPSGTPHQLSGPPREERVLLLLLLLLPLLLVLVLVVFLLLFACPSQLLMLPLLHAGPALLVLRVPGCECGGQCWQADAARRAGCWVLWGGRSGGAGDPVGEPQVVAIPGGLHQAGNKWFVRQKLKNSSIQVTSAPVVFSSDGLHNMSTDDCACKTRSTKWIPARQPEMKPLLPHSSPASYKTLHHAMH